METTHSPAAALAAVLILTAAAAAPPASAGGDPLVAELTGDDHLDVLRTVPAVKLSRGLGDGGFEDATAAVGLAGQAPARGALQADLDGDGLADILLVRGPGESTLLRRDAEGSYRDVSGPAGIAELGDATLAACADVDLDGDLDLFVGTGAGGALWRNRGNGTFELAAEGAPRPGGPCAGAAFGDFDRDRDPDLYVSVSGGPDELWHNGGDGTFTVGDAGPSEAGGPVHVLDFDNDRFQELFIELADGVRAVDADRGVLTDVTGTLGLGSAAGEAVRFADLDGDGFVDLCRSRASGRALWKSDRARRFELVAEVEGLGSLPAGPGITFADFDNDGDEDLLLPDGVHENAGAPKAWICVELEGATSNRSAVGCQIRVLTRSRRGYERQYLRDVAAPSTFGEGTLRTTIALGDAEVIVRLEVYWPATGRWQSFFQLRKNCKVVVSEGSSDLRFAWHL